MAQNRLQDMTIKQMQLTPTQYAPVELKVPTQDWNLYANSMAQLEARQEKASEKQTAIDVSLAQIEDKLNPNEIEWFNSYKKDIQDQIQNEVDAGNYGSAIKLANRLAGKTATDTRLLGRLKANELYQQARKEVMSRTDIDQDVKDWWLDTNQYSYEDKYDDNGNVIGGTYSQYDFRPAAQIDYSSLAAKAIQLAAPEKDAVTTETTTHRGSSSDRTNADGTGRGSSSSTTVSDMNSLSRQWLTEEKLNEVMEAVLAGTPGAKAAILQDRAVSMWKLSKLEQQLETATTEEDKARIQNELDIYRNDLYDGGILMTTKEYTAKKISPILHNAAYDWKEKRTAHSDSRDSSSSVNNHAVGGGGGGGGGVGSFFNGVTQLPQGFGGYFAMVPGGVVQIPWGGYATQAKQESANAAETGKTIVKGNNK